MKTTITADYLATLITALSNAPTAVSAWQPDTRYVEGAKVRSGSKIYMASNTGMSSKVAPTATSGKAVDGTITWMFAYDVANRQSLGEAFYLALGDGGEWADEPTPDDLTDTYTDTVTALENVIALFRLVPGDISLGVRRINWATGTVIPEWPAVDSYVLVDQSVYRCLSNNNGAQSTTQPTGVSLTPFELVDGYVWKYLGDISISQDQKFGQTAVFPISALYVDDGSSRSLVQSMAKNGGISGFIRWAQLHASSLGTRFYGCTVSDNASLGITGIGAGTATAASTHQRYGVKRVDTSRVITAYYADIFDQKVTWSLTNCLRQSGSQTPTAVGNTYRQSGRLVNLRGALTAVAAGTAANAILVDLPAAVAIPAALVGHPIGTFTASIGGTLYAGVTIAQATTTLSFQTSAGTNLLGVNPAATLAIGSTLNFSATWDLG